MNLLVCTFALVALSVGEKTEKLENLPSSCHIPTDKQPSFFWKNQIPFYYSDILEECFLDLQTLNENCHNDGNLKFNVLVHC